MTSYPDKHEPHSGISTSQIHNLLQQLSGPYWLMGALLYSAALQPKQCVALRVGDLDLMQERLQLPDQRCAILAPQLIPHIKLHLARLRTRHLKALAQGDGWVNLPMSPHVSRDWYSQYLFPASGFGMTRNGLKIKYAFPEERLVRAVRCAAQALRRDTGCSAISAYDLRRTLALHMVESGCPVQTMKRYLSLAQGFDCQDSNPLLEAALYKVFNAIFAPRTLGQPPHPDFVSEPAAVYRIAS